MRILVTGHNGYIGPVMVPLLLAAGHDVAGLDSDLFDECTFTDAIPRVPAVRKDIRDIQPSDLVGFDAIVHLAALSNDPLGNHSPLMKRRFPQFSAIFATRIVVVIFTGAFRRLLTRLWIGQSRLRKISVHPSGRLMLGAAAEPDR